MGLIFNTSSENDPDPSTEATHLRGLTEVGFIGLKKKSVIAKVH